MFVVRSNIRKFLHLPGGVTFVALAVAVAVTVCFNSTAEVSPRDFNGPWPPSEFAVGEPAPDAPLRGYAWNVSYGWPLLWRQYVVTTAYGPVAVVGRYISAYRFVVDVVIWVALLLSVGAGCEWLGHRYRLRLRWGLRSMLFATVVLSAFCAWVSAGYRRATVEDSVMATLSGPGARFRIEFRGPGWLDAFGAHRLRRRVVGAWVDVVDDDGKVDNEVLRQVALLPDLECLLVQTGEVTPELTGALLGMRRLRILSIDGLYGENSGPRLADGCLSAIGRLTRLEHLDLRFLTMDGRSLAHLGALSKLKSLGLSSISRGLTGGVSDEPFLKYLPPFPDLQALDLQNSGVAEGDLRCLRGLPRLTSVNLDGTGVSGRGLKTLASLPALAELSVCSNRLSAVAISSLVAARNLKRLHLTECASTRNAQAVIALDHGGSLYASEAERDEWGRALAELRRANRGIVIDADNVALQWDAGGMLPWVFDEQDESRAVLIEAVRQWKGR